jgi:ABC-2 type transport system permease protein
MLVETFAQYSALLVMEQHYGKDQVRRFLKFELDRYLRSRGGAVLEELPLDRVENQDYIYYRKGSVAMYWAKEALGQEVVDRALRKLLAQYAFKGAPYANTTDFLRLLRAEAGPDQEQVISDLFEKITLLDLKAGNAVATRLPNGRYSVKFDVEAHKFYADGAGKETAAAMDEPVDIGVFSARPGDKGFGAANVLLLRKVPVHGPPMSVTVEVDGRPSWVGIDPYNKRIDRNSDDNLAPVDAPR